MRVYNQSRKIESVQLGDRVDPPGAGAGESIDFTPTHNLGSPLAMNRLRQSTRWVHAWPRTTNHSHRVKAGSQLQSQIRRNLITYSTAAEARSVTKVEKIILDTIKVGQFSPFGCNLV